MEHSSKKTSIRCWPDHELGFSSASHADSSWQHVRITRTKYSVRPNCNGSQSVRISCQNCLQMTNSDTHTHTPFNGLFLGLPRWAGTRKAKPIWILLKQERVSGSGISWAKCKSAPCSRQTTTPAPHHSVFLQTGCPSCRPTNSVKALKAHMMHSEVE